MGKTVKDLVEIIQGREDYEILEGYTGYFYYEGTYDFNIDWDCKTHTYGRDVLKDIEKNSIPMDASVCIWDNDDFHSWNLTHGGFEVDDKKKMILLICRPFD